MRNKSIGKDKFSLGVCYYPEHWDRELWESDLTRMKAVGIHTIRIAEFAWNLFEPTEGVFTYDFFDSYLDLTEKFDMKVIFGTPTATPPAWLTEKYPEVLNCDINGIPYRHGMRRHYNYNSPKYRELTARIVEKIAEHYGSRKTIIGWQIDNELNCETDVFYSESDSAAFREFLKEKYGTLDKLNKQWGAIFWNQTYTDWNEVHVPRKTVNDSTNPHEIMDYKRFISESVISFAKLQADIIRRYSKPGDFITTNGVFGNLDSHKFTDDVLDFMTYDSYPNFNYSVESFNAYDKLRDRGGSNPLAVVRSISPQFGVMEQQSGANGWTSRMIFPAPKPGQMTLWAMQSIAHGADFVSFFRWRTSTMGSEIYWHGILDYDNRDNRKYAEVGKINELTSKIADIAGAEYKAEYAMIRDYNNLWDSELDVWHKRFSGTSNYGFFTASQFAHAPMDYLYLQDNTTAEDLKRYKVLFYPHAVILTEKVVKLLSDYVSDGGTLVFGCRTGVKDESGKCPMAKLPGLAAELSAVDVYESTFVHPMDGKVFVDWDGTKLEAATYNDILRPDSHNAEVLGRYTDSYYCGEAGLIRNKYGKGEVYYFGGAFSTETVSVFLKKLGLYEPYADILTLPESIELAVREKDGQKYIFVLNYEGKAVSIELKKPMLSAFEGKEALGEVSIPAYGVLVFKL